MKNFITIVAAMVLGVTMLAGCSASSSNQASSNEAVDGGDDISVVATIFPEYDWVKEIVGDTQGVEETLLVDTGVDLHSYQPSAEDILTISECDMFIYVGGESDEWVEDALKSAVNEDMVVINLLDVLGEDAAEEEVVEGMQEEAEEAEEESEEEVEYDEHVWLSLKNAVKLCTAIEEGLEKVDAAHADAYKANLDSYQAQLENLDAEYAQMVENAQVTTVLFGDRFPFRYLVDDYGLDYYAAFVGCSAESEASFETITYLAQKVDELGLSSILQIESSDGKIAQTIKENTTNKDQQILTLDSMQSTTAEDADNGVTYLSTMESNLEVLTQALQK
ncbi:metal ABC transporter substrate-binding protein [Eubacterium oxidoreducens]|nr:metal ABC transporter substrate-binding protein [Eubacterium oxidoreducens]